MERCAAVVQPVTSCAMEIAGHMRNIPFTRPFTRHFAALTPNPKVLRGACNRQIDSSIGFSVLNLDFDDFSIPIAAARIAHLQGRPLRCGTEFGDQGRRKSRHFTDLEITIFDLKRELGPLADPPYQPFSRSANRLTGAPTRKIGI
jgi:hypothetical protein